MAMEKTENNKQRLNFLVINLILSVLVGYLFSVFREEIQYQYLISFIVLLALYSLIALARVRGRATIEEVSDMEELIKICLQSDNFVFVLILLFWLIFLVMYQSFFLAIGYSDSTSGLAIADGAIVSFVYSLFVVSIGVILATRKVKKKLLAMALLFTSAAVSISLWIILSSVIIGILLRLS